MAEIIKQVCATLPYLSGVKNKLLYIAIVLAIIGVVLLGTSTIVIRNYPAAMLGIVLGGALLQASLTAFAIKFG